METTSPSFSTQQFLTQLWTRNHRVSPTTLFEKVLPAMNGAPPMWTPTRTLPTSWLNHCQMEPRGRNSLRCCCITSLGRHWSKHRMLNRWQGRFYRNFLPTIYFYFWLPSESVTCPFFYFLFSWQTRSPVVIRLCGECFRLHDRRKRYVIAHPLEFSDLLVVHFLVRNAYNLIAPIIKRLTRNLSSHVRQIDVPSTMRERATTYRINNNWSCRLVHSISYSCSYQSVEYCSSSSFSWDIPHVVYIKYYVATTCGGSPYLTKQRRDDDTVVATVPFIKSLKFFLGFSMGVFSFNNDRSANPGNRTRISSLHNLPSHHHIHKAILSSFEEEKTCSPQIPPWNPLWTICLPRMSMKSFKTRRKQVILKWRIRSLSLWLIEPPH